MAFDLREQLQQSLGGAYRIERELGGGGMSRVFQAVETALRRKVVVKVLLPELAAGVSVERFRREIQVAAQLQHPHIVPLLSAGDAGGLPWFTMPFVDGESLRARLVRDGELPVADAVRVLRDVASALSYAHAQGVAHRDIKPDNVLLAHGVAVVTDFGVAKALTVSAGPDSTPRAGLTSLGIALGTPAYMAPEQASADPGMDHRVDIYSFGATAYEVLTGQPVFGGRTPQAMLGAHITALPEPITNRRPGIPPLLALVVMKCLEKRPADRPQTASDIVNALDMLTTPSGGTVPITPVRVGRMARWRMAARANLRRLAPVAGALVVVGAVAALAWLGRGREAPPPPQTPAVAPAEPRMRTPPPVAAVPEPSPAESVPVRPTPAPRARPRPAPDRPPAAVPAPPAAEDKALLDRLRTEAAAARERAARAGADASVLARGDSGVRRADSLAGLGRTAAAAAQLSTTGALWNSAAAEAERAAAAEAVTPEPEPPPAPAPAPVPAAAAPQPPADPAPQIRALFEEYGAAIEARSLDAIRRTYPGLQPQQARDWESFFAGVSEVQVDLKVVGLEVMGDSARAQLEGVYVFADPGTHRTLRENVAFQALVRRTAGRWRIASLR